MTRPIELFNENSYNYGPPEGVWWHELPYGFTAAVSTIHGFVEATLYRRLSTAIDPRESLSLVFMQEGRLFHRQYRGKRISQRYAVTLARRFADEVTGADC